MQIEFCKFQFLHSIILYKVSVFTMLDWPDITIPNNSPACHMNIECLLGTCSALFGIQSLSLLVSHLCSKGYKLGHFKKANPVNVAV